MARDIIIGTRGSDLALWQANFVMAELKKLGVSATLKIIKTQGDKIQNIGFDKMEGKGFFTKEIEAALLSKEVDLAVHSHKDLETNQPAGLKIACVSDRETPKELFLIQKDAVDHSLSMSVKAKAIVGTSSARRKSQLLAFRDDIELKDLRGNVPTRIQKLREGQYDAIMVAAAGVERLKIDLSEFHVETLDPREFVPAPAQGVLGLQIREEDKELEEVLSKMNNERVKSIIDIEREVLNKFHGGCQIPLGVYVEKEADNFKLWGSVSKSWDGYPRRVYLAGKNGDELAKSALEKLQRPQGNKSVFITRNLPDKTYFKNALEKNGFRVSGKALTRFEQVAFDTIPNTDWVFFSSKNCVKHFFSQNPQLGEEVKLGAIGGATAAAVKKLGYSCAFVGTSTNTKEIGRQFANEVEGQTVLFPQSSSSYRTVQKQFKDSGNLYELVAYNSVPVENVEIPNTDIVVLTSPTNAILYFRNGGTKEGKTFVAMGNSTGDKLKEMGVEDYLLPWNSSVIALVDTIQSI